MSEATDMTAQGVDKGEEEVVDVTRVPARHVRLPDGIVTPIQLLNRLVQKKMAPADTAPQRMYGFVKSPGKEDPFPVKHFDANGNTYDEPQENDGGLTYTRPGIEVKAGIEWWSRAGQRQEDKLKKKAEKAAAKKKKEAEKAAAASAASADDTGTADTEIELEGGDESEGEYVEAEAE